MLLAFGLVESLLHSRRLKAIPLRIGVTGTRGKSTVTRIIAAALRQSGICVVAKTTGSRARLILPDGREEDIRRRGPASIREGMRIARRAADLGADILVAEFMALQPETLAAESRNLIRPHLLVVTNARPDHPEMGRTARETAASLAKAVPAGATVFIPEEDDFTEFRKRTESLGCRVITVSVAEPGRRPENEAPPPGIFQADLRLALAVADFLGVPGRFVMSGAAGMVPDLGAPRAWSWNGGGDGSRWVFVNGFAANDPLSTRSMLDTLRGKDGFGEGWVGLLNLRTDRGERTLQWRRALEAGCFPEFRSLIILGAQSRLLTRQLRPYLAGCRLAAVDARSVDRVLARLRDLEPEGAVVVGLGNMDGLGRELVERWDRIGRRHDL